MSIYPPLLYSNRARAAHVSLHSRTQSELEHRNQPLQSAVCAYIKHEFVDLRTVNNECLNITVHFFVCFFLVSACRYLGAATAAVFVIPLKFDGIVVRCQLVIFSIAVISKNEKQQSVWGTQICYRMCLCIPFSLNILKKIANHLANVKMSFNWCKKKEIRNKIRYVFLSVFFWSLFCLVCKFWNSPTYTANVIYTESNMLSLENTFLLFFFAIQPNWIEKYTSPSRILY